MAQTTPHPNKQTIEDFAHGLLEESASETVATHIESCDTCCVALENVPLDRFSILARSAYESSAVCVEESVPSKTIANEIPESLRMLERYRIIERIGSGGMGDVYRAEHKLMDRLVAIKVINPTLTGNNEAVSRFRNEVRAAAKLNHPNIVASYDADNVDDLHFLAMELVEGQSLAELVKRNGTFHPTDVIEIARGVAAGLEVAHKKGMVHRDIKPHNLMIDDATGQVKILDFGLARFEREQLEIASVRPQSAGLTGTNIAIGTPDYLSPEQARNAGDVDIRTDIYSLGCTLYFLLTGQPPFPNGTPMEKISKHLSAQPQPLGEFSPDTPAKLATVIEQMMEKNPEDRFQTPTAVLQKLNKLQAVSVESKIPEPNRRATKWILTSLVAVAVAAFALMSLPSLTKSAADCRVLIVTSNEMFFDEYEPLKSALSERNIESVTAAFHKTIKDVDDTPGDLIAADILLEDADPREFDAVIFVGGHHEQILGSGEAASEVTRIVSAIEPTGIIAAISGGEEVLTELGFDDTLDGPNNLSGFEVFSAEGVVTTTEPQFADRFVDAILDAVNSKASLPED